ncbi:MAG TPA: hypothetical protein PLG50_09515 [bacterium]|nr:hypothetical protein [bacterium]HQG45886.1 hypothetical protein [bacterium]HQI48342.1 hypothetical protein [bacterium]HQJ63444.1 hypothetical protein [bacterium]
MKKLVLFVALLFVIALTAGALHAVVITDDKAKSTTIQKEECCKKGAAECKDKAACTKECCKEKKEGCCPAQKDQAACAPKSGSCPGSCPAKAECERK